MLYRTSSTKVGEAAKEVKPERPVLHGFNGKFSRALASAGNYKNDGFKTHVETDRWLDFSKDWENTKLWQASKKYFMAWLAW